jgi:hypothetical protein
MLKNLKPVFLLHALYISLLGIAIPFTAMEFGMSLHGLDVTSTLTQEAAQQSLSSIKMLDIITPFLSSYLWFFLVSSLVLGFFLFFMTAFTLSVLRQEEVPMPMLLRRSVKAFFFRGLFANLIILIVSFLVGFPSNAGIGFLSLTIVVPFIVIETRLKAFQSVWAAVSLSQLKVLGIPRLRIYLFLLSVGFIVFFGLLLGDVIKNFFVLSDESLGLARQNWFSVPTSSGLSRGYVVGVAAMYVWHGVLVATWAIVATSYYSLALKGLVVPPASKDAE